MSDNNLMNCIQHLVNLFALCVCVGGEGAGLLTGGGTNHQKGCFPFILLKFSEKHYEIKDCLASVFVWKGGRGEMRVGKTTAIPFFNF